MNADQLLRLWQARDRAAGPRKARDRDTLAFFEGRVAVPLPEIDANEASAVANLMQQGITAQAQRMASVPPLPIFPVSRPSAAAKQRARNKQRAIQGMWDENRLHLQRQQRFRWLIAYAASPVVLWPRYVNGRWTVRWEPRTWLSAYPAPTATYQDMEPDDVIFATSMPRSQVEAKWPDYRESLRGMTNYNRDNPRDELLTLVEYFGADTIAVVCVGGMNDRARDLAPYMDGIAVAGNQWCAMLTQTPNRVGRCTAIIPSLTSLEAPMSKFEATKGMYQMQARLFALEYRAVANSVDPAQWFVENDTGGEIVTMADGPAGIMGHIRGGQHLVVNVQGNYKATEMVDRLERAQRLQAGTPAELGGESASNIRTARRGQDLLASVLDFPTQEAQDLLAESQRLEDNLAIDMALAYFPDMSRSWGAFEFTPSQTFKPSDEEWHTVDYSLAGADADGLVIRVGQLVGQGLMSKDTGRKNMPDIKDPEYEHDQVIAEQIEQGILAEFMQPGSATLIDKARVSQLVGDNKKDLAEAIMQAQTEAQTRQAPDVNPVAPGSPEAQPGMVPPGSGAEAGTSPAAPDLAGLSSLLTQLRGPQQFTTPQERAAAVQQAAG